MKRETNKVPFFEKDTLSQYMRDISQYPLITVEQERSLAEAYANGDCQAKELLVKSNLRLVVKIAYDFMGRGLPLMDLIAEGNIGLMKAAERFDPSKGAKFSSYSMWWIKCCMRKALINQRKIIRIPYEAYVKMNQIYTRKKEFSQKNSRQPTLPELSKETGYSVQTLKSLRNQWNTTVSSDETIAGTDMTYNEFLEDKSQEEKDDRLPIVDELWERSKDFLTPMEYDIVMRRFGLNGSEETTLNELSLKYDKTRERIRQIQVEALKKIRKQYLALEA